MILRVVLDTNVWISGLFWKGTVSRLINKVEREKITPCFSLTTFTEWSTKVKTIAEFTQKTHFFLRYKEQLSKHSFFVVPKEKITLSRDPDDDKFLEVAVAAKADLLVSGDKDLLDLVRIQNIPIVSPKEFLTQVDR